ncbi:unnamed protein product [Adineta steineri]|uniref:SAP domain-containing protein n=2 Tax=Bdelloidea TaxID=44578 RepID=A0A814YFN5_9BILA|nr:unnamed protein product [Adineta steineri]
MSILKEDDSPQQQINEQSLTQELEKNRESLKRKLQTRRSLKQLVDVGIMPPPKAPLPFYEQRKQLQMRKTQDILKNKIISRPDRQLLIEHNILSDTTAAPAIQKTQRQLKRARLADNLNDKLAARPGILELVANNILETDPNLKEAIQGGRIKFPSTKSTPISTPILTTPVFCSTDSQQQRPLRPKTSSFSNTTNGQSFSSITKRSLTSTLKAKSSLTFHEYKGPSRKVEVTKVPLQPTPSLIVQPVQATLLPLVPLEHDSTLNKNQYRIQLKQQQLFLELLHDTKSEDNDEENINSEINHEDNLIGNLLQQPFDDSVNILSTITDDIQAFEKMKVTDLKNECRKLNLSTTGTKMKLIEKLRNAKVKMSDIAIVPSPTINTEPSLTQMINTSTSSVRLLRAIQANMAVFGAEQIRGQQAIARYFNKYYIAVNTGSFLAFAIIAYIQQNENYFLGYCISSGLLGITIILFLAGYKHYNHVKPHDSVITNFFPVFFNAFQSWRKYQPHTTRIFMRRRSSHKAMLTSDQYENMDGSPFIVNEQRIPFLDYAKVENNGRFQDRIVDDIKSLRRIIVMFLLLIPYWLIYLQSDTTFIIQGVHMRVPAFQSKTRHMPVLWLSLSDQIIVILTLFILNTCVYKYFYIKNRLVSIKIRFIIGMIAATISMCLTGITEIFRQKNCNNSFQQSIGNTIYNTSDMSVFYQLPQYISIGLSEVFASVTSLEFAYLTAPQSAQSLVMSLRFCSIGLSSFLGSGYINVYENFYGNFSVTNSECKDAEKPELFYIYFFVLAGIQFIFIFIFLGCDRKYHIIKASQHRFNTSLFVGSTSETSNA